MNVQSVVDQAGRLIEDVQRQAREFLSRGSATEAPTVGVLWEKASPVLDRALAVYDQKESPDTPESSWNPLRTTKRSCQEEIDDILDAALTVLGTCGAAGYRQRIRDLQAENVISRSRIAGYREQCLSAPEEQSQNFIEGLVAQSKEALKDSIADETDRIAARIQQIEGLKVGFREHLIQIGLSVSSETADTFLLPVEDELVSMAAVITNIGRLTEQLQELVDASREAPAETKKYYGMYVLLVLAVDRIQTHFTRQISEHFLPKVAKRETDAVRHMADAQAQLAHGGPRESLMANIAANKRTIDACRLLSETLRCHRRSVLDQNRDVRIQAAAAVNSYRTVCTGLDVADMIGRCQTAFQALRELKLPPLRPFQNHQLSEEMQRLAEGVVAKE
jgi:hypothetical protein